MNLKMMLVVFGSVFLAELGDKTQLATLLFASDQKMGKAEVFVSSSLALVLSCLLAVLAGSQVHRLVSPQTLKIIAGVGFVLIGLWSLWGVKG